MYAVGIVFFDYTSIAHIPQLANYSFIQIWDNYPIINIYHI